jgi:hypothetical protein
MFGIMTVEEIREGKREGRKEGRKNGRKFTGGGGQGTKGGENN